MCDVIRELSLWLLYDFCERLGEYLEISSNDGAGCYSGILRFVYLV